MNIRLLYFIFLSLLLPIKGYAQQCIVQLQVKDKHSTAIPNAICKLIKDSVHISTFSITDSIGQAQLNAPKGQYILNISHFGQILYNKPIAFTESVDLGVIVVEHQSLMMDEVTITAQRKNIKEVDGKLLFDVRSIPIQKNANAIDALTYTPLVTVSTSGISIAGENAELRINGIKQNKGVSLYDYLSAIQLDQIERIEVHNGRTANLDASTVGGYVNIILYNPSGFQGYTRTNISYNGKSYEPKRRNLFSESLSSGIV